MPASRLRHDAKHPIWQGKLWATHLILVLKDHHHVGAREAATAQRVALFLHAPQERLRPCVLSPAAMMTHQVTRCRIPSLFIISGKGPMPFRMFYSRSSPSADCIVVKPLVWHTKSLGAAYKVYAWIAAKDPICHSAP
jgi:hypothetical protein